MRKLRPYLLIALVFTPALVEYVANLPAVVPSPRPALLGHVVP